MTAKEFLFKHGQTAANLNAQQILTDYLAEMQNGLNGFGSIPMVPTYIRNVGRDKIKSGKKILIDAGGTNFRSAIGCFEDGKAVITNLTKTQMPGADGKPLGKEEFYSKIAQNVKDIAELGGNVGFCFSYQVDMGADVDGKVVCFSKEIHAPEVVGTKVGAETLAAISRYSNKQRKIAIINDTVATLLGGVATLNEPYGGYVGYIYGTGTNLCYAEDVKNIKKVTDLGSGKMLINTESGGFDKIPRGDFDVIVANATAEPGRQHLEKMSSGKYLSDVIFASLTAAKSQGIVSPNTGFKPFALKEVSAFLLGENDFGVAHCDRQFVRDVCLELIDRAALIGAIINAGACIKTQAEGTIAIVAEGTTFYKLPTFRDKFILHLHELLDGKNVSFEVVRGTDLNLVGTLMATMML